MPDERHPNTPNMQKFFDKLIALKNFVASKVLEEGDENMIEVLRHLDGIIKIDESRGDNNE